VEEEVWWDGRHRAGAAEATGRREPAFEETGGGFVLGQTHPARGAGKKSLKPARRRELARWLAQAFAVSQRRACRLVLLGRSTFSYRSQAQDQGALRLRLKELAAVRVRYGYRADDLVTAGRVEGWQAARLSPVSAREPAGADENATEASDANTRALGWSGAAEPALVDGLYE